MYLHWFYKCMLLKEKKLMDNTLIRGTDMWSISIGIRYSYLFLNAWNGTVGDSRKAALSMQMTEGCVKSRAKWNKEEMKMMI